jgi:hypothetical protein
MVQEERTESELGEFDINGMGYMRHYLHVTICIVSEPQLSSPYGKRNEIGSLKIRLKVTSMHVTKRGECFVFESLDGSR